MKETIKKLSIIALMLVMVLSLTGCGDKEEKDEDKKEEKVDDNTIIATRDVDEDGVKYKEETEIKLKDGIVNTVKMTMTFEDEETAEEMKEILDQTVEMIKAMAEENIQIETKQSGKTLTMELDEATFSLMSGMDVSEEKVTKEELKKSFEESGYEVK